MNKRRLYPVIAAFCILLCSSSFIFAQQGVMSGAGKLRVTQTEWFDIIYAEKNSVTAQILYEKADDIYRELAAAYGIEPYFRIPVVITSTVEQFNAYQTNTPYAAIVLYDTAVISDLAVFSQTIASTFTHELTHALTYNHKSKLFRSLAKIFGDGFAGYYLSVTKGMAEGATVSYESSSGEGRLNDSYTLQMLRQAKIEDKFPSYSDVKGAADTYPANSFYYFNGAFAQYLQQNYGMDKYAEFWYRCVNVKNLTAAGAFKKTYGIKLNKAWSDFKDALEVPEIKGADPVALGQALDFFEPQSKNFSLKNNAGSLYSDLCISSKGIYYIDSTHSSVYFVSSSQLGEGGVIKPKKLFRHDYIESLKVSADGRFAAVGYYSTMSTNVKHGGGIYDLQNKTWFTIPKTNIVSPSVIMQNGQYYLVMQNYEPQKYSIVVKKILLDKKIKGLEDYACLDFAPEEIPVDFTDLGDGRFAFIKKAAMDYYLCVTDASLCEITEYAAPVSGIKYHSLSAFDGSLAFSWATKDTLPRLGFLNTDNGQFSLCAQNISGGIYNPVVFDTSTVVYISQFYRQNRILQLQKDSQQFEQYEVVAENTGTGPDPTELAELPSQSPVNLPYKPFNPFMYVTRGLLLPVSTASSNNFMNYGSQGSYLTPFGFTYITSLPWTAGLTTLTGGYGIKTKSAVLGFDYQGGAGTSIISYDLSSNVELDRFGFKQVGAAATVSSSFDFGTRNAVLFSLYGQADYGRLSYTNSTGKVVNDNKDVYFKNYESFVATYSNVVSSGPGTFERTGFNFSAGVVHSGAIKVKPQNTTLLNVYDFVMGVDFYVPHLIPIRCIDNFTYNLPVKIRANLFPMNGSGYSAASASAQALLFGYDIQRAIPGVSALYINDVEVSIKYTGGTDFTQTADYEKNWHIAYLDEYIKQAAEGKFKYRDYATVKLSLGFTPNVGAFAENQFRNNLYIAYSFGKKQNLPQKVLDFGLEAHF